jgi:Sec-independent protein translocase protein TatA
MIALPVLPWLKIGLVAVIALALFGTGYGYGRGSCTRAAVKAMEKEVKRVESEAAKAIKQAEKDATRLAKLDKGNKEIKDEASEILSANSCPLTDDELRLLRKVQGQTKR